MESFPIPPEAMQAFPLGALNVLVAVASSVAAQHGVESARRVCAELAANDDLWIYIAGRLPPSGENRSVLEPRPRAESSSRDPEAEEPGTPPNADVFPQGALPLPEGDGTNRNDPPLPPIIVGVGFPATHDASAGASTVTAEAKGAQKISATNTRLKKTARKTGDRRSKQKANGVAQ